MRWGELSHFTAVANLCVTVTVMMEVSDTKCIAVYQLDINLKKKK